MPDVNFLQPNDSAAKPPVVVSGKRQQKKEKKVVVPPPAPAPTGLGVNLMTEDSLKRVTVDQEKRSGMLLLYSIGAGLALTALLFGGVKVYGLVVAQRERQLSVDLGKADGEIALLEQNTSALTLFQDKLVILKSLFDNHVYWSQFVASLEKYTLPTVSYDALSVSPGSEITLSASAPNFYTLAQQLQIFQKDAAPLMSAVKITSGNAQLSQQGDVASVSFDVSFTMNPEVLKRK